MIKLHKKTSHLQVRFHADPSWSWMSEISRNYVFSSSSLPFRGPVIWIAVWKKMRASVWECVCKIHGLEKPQYLSCHCCQISEEEWSFVRDVLITALNTFSVPHLFQLQKMWSCRSWAGWWDIRGPAEHLLQRARNLLYLQQGQVLHHNLPIHLPRGDQTYPSSSDASILLRWLAQPTAILTPCCFLFSYHPYIYSTIVPGQLCPKYQLLE